MHQVFTVGGESASATLKALSSFPLRSTHQGCDVADSLPPGHITFLATTLLFARCLCPNTPAALDVQQGGCFCRGGPGVSSVGDWVDGEPVLGSLSPSGACASPQLCSPWSGIILRNYIQIWMPERLCSSETLESDGTVLLEIQIQRQGFLTEVLMGF